jgi:hypothetical protein
MANPFLFGPTPRPFASVPYRFGIRIRQNMKFVITFLRISVPCSVQPWKIGKSSITAKDLAQPLAATGLLNREWTRMDANKRE